MEAVAQEDLVGTRVSHYAIVDLVGTGGMGRVYRGRDERLLRDVAIKVLGEAAAPGGRRGALVTEARALSRLTHPHVAGVYDLVTESDRDFLIMEFVPGATVKDILAHGPLPIPEVVRLGVQMAHGLAAAHAAWLVHRDIKPGNLKVTSSGDLKILDFGLARSVPHPAAADDGTRSAASHGVEGTIPYMSPEQLRGEAADERSDVFSAGAVLYEMATGQRAFPQRQVALLIDALLHQRPAAPSAVNPFVPRWFDRVVMKALAKQAADRHASASDLARALTSGADAPAARPARGRVAHWLTHLVG